MRIGQTRQSCAIADNDGVRFGLGTGHHGAEAIQLLIIDLPVLEQIQLLALHGKHGIQPTPKHCYINQ